MKEYLGPHVISKKGNLHIRVQASEILLTIWLHWKENKQVQTCWNLSKFAQNDEFGLWFHFKRNKQVETC